MISGIQLARRARSFQPLARRLRTQAQSYDYVSREEVDDPLVRSAGLATPRQVFLLVSGEGCSSLFTSS